MENEIQKLEKENLENKKKPVENLEKIVKNLFIEKYKYAENRFQSILIQQKTDAHARGEISFAPTPDELAAGFPGEGGIFLIAKINNKWELVFDGNAAILCAEIEKYNFPEKMIQNCTK